MGLKALCGMGGEASVIEQNWIPNPSKEIKYIVTSVPNKVTTRKAICQPVDCKFANQCTKKVHIVRPKDNGFSKATIRDIRYNMSAINETNIFARSIEDLS